MDASKKEKMEQKGILILLLIFTLVLGSTLKNMGIIGGKKKKVPMEDLKQIAHVMKDLPGAMKARSIERIVETYQESLAAIKETERLGLEIELPGYSYTALTERDPLWPTFHVVEEREPAVLIPSESSEPLKRPRRQTPKASQRPKLVRLQGVFWGGNNPTVIVQDEVYGLGDFLGGSAEIVAITNAGVTVNQNGRFFQIGVFRKGRSEEDALNWRPVAAPQWDAGSGKDYSMAAESLSLHSEGSLLGMPRESPLLEGK